MYKVSKKLYVFTLLDKVLFLVNCSIWYCTMQIVSAAGLLVPEGSIRPMVSALALKWFIIYSIYILYRN